MMTKKLYIIRHAKSSYALLGESDFSRLLSETGFLEINKMTKRLMEKTNSFDALYCSTALRTVQTAMEFCEQMDIDKKKLVYLDKLYHASSETLKEVVSTIDNQFNSVCIIAHNPGITDFVNQIQSKIEIDDVPTCGIVGIEAICENWIDFGNVDKKVIFFNYPNMEF
jgi:phosphohistidine phosphatase